MISILSQLKNKCKPAAFYADIAEPGSFIYGYLLSSDENATAIHMIDKEGRDDGIIVLATDYIFKVEVDGMYSEKMKVLCADNDFNTYNLHEECGDIFRDWLLYAVNNGELVSFELCKSGCDDAVGFPVINENDVVVSLIDVYGNKDGTAYFSFSDITMLEFASENQRNIKKLYCKSITK